MVSNLVQSLSGWRVHRLRELIIIAVAVVILSAASYHEARYNGPAVNQYVQAVLCDMCLCVYVCVQECKSSLVHTVCLTLCNSFRVR